MLTTDGECRIGSSIGPICKFDRARVAEFLGERNLVPAETRRAHVDGEQPAVRPASKAMSPAAVSKLSASLPVSLADQRGDAAHAVAAGARLRAVIVVDADEGVGAAARRIKRHELVVGLLPRRRARFGRADRGRRAAQVDDDDLVAETVHLDEVRDSPARP